MIYFWQKTRERSGYAMASKNGGDAAFTLVMIDDGEIWRPIYCGNGRQEKKHCRKHFCGRERDCLREAWDVFCREIADTVWFGRFEALALAVRDKIASRSAGIGKAVKRP